MKSKVHKTQFPMKTAVMNAEESQKPVKIKVIGGGITGLSAAHRLVELSREAKLPVELALIEASGRLGGAFGTEKIGDFTIETGADSFITNKPWGVNLCRRLGNRRSTHFAQQGVSEVTHSSSWQDSSDSDRLQFTRPQSYLANGNDSHAKPAWKIADGSRVVCFPSKRSMGMRVWLRSLEGGLARRCWIVLCSQWWEGFTLLILSS